MKWQLVVIKLVTFILLIIEWLELNQEVLRVLQVPFIFVPSLKGLSSFLILVILSPLLVKWWFIVLQFALPPFLPLLHLNQ